MTLQSLKKQATEAKINYREGTNMQMDDPVSVVMFSSLAECLH